MEFNLKNRPSPFKGCKIGEVDEWFEKFEDQNKKENLVHVDNIRNKKIKDYTWTSGIDKKTCKGYNEKHAYLLGFYDGYQQKRKEILGEIK